MSFNSKTVVKTNGFEWAVIRMEIDGLSLIYPHKIELDCLAHERCSSACSFVSCEFAVDAYCRRVLLQGTSPELYQFVFHNVMLLPEAALLGWRRLATLVFQGCTFDSVDKLCDSVRFFLAWVRPLIHRRTFEESALDCRVDNSNDEELAVATSKYDEVGSLSVFPVDSKCSGGNPPALGSPLLQGDRLLYTTSQSACSKVAGGNPPAFGSPLCVEDHILYITHQNWMGGCCFLQEFLANSSQVVSSKASFISEEPMVGRIVAAPLITQCGKLDSADIVGYLKEMVVVWPGVSIDCRMLGEAASNRLMDGMLNDLLPIVVVDFHAVKALEELKLGVNELLEIPFDTLGKFVHARKLALLVAQDMVAIGGSLGEDAEVGEVAFSSIERHCVVLIMPAHDRCEVEWHSVEFRIREAAHVLLDALAKILVLVVEYECDQVEGGAVADVSRFVYEDGKLPHQAAPSVIKMPRETPRLRDSPPCVESHFSYTTSRSAESIVCEPEHKFVTIDANTCSIYGRAA